MSRKSELLQSRNGRPSAVVVDGWTHFIAVRDGEYERQLKGWKRLRAAAHPDKGGTATKFRLTQRAFQRWRLTEARWYAQFGLLPPDGWAGAGVVAARRRRLKGLSDGTAE